MRTSWPLGRHVAPFYSGIYISAKQIADKLSGNNTMSPNLDNFKRSFLPLTHGDGTVATVGTALKRRAGRMAAGLRLVFRQDSTLNQKVWSVAVS